MPTTDRTPSPGADTGGRDGSVLVSYDKWTGADLGSVPVATPGRIDAALAAATGAVSRPWPPPERAAMFRRLLGLLGDHHDELRDTMVAETGFTTKDVDFEIARGRVALEECAQESTRVVGAAVSLDASPGFAGTSTAFTLRVPRGVVLAITPFNTPVNGAIHKVGPALASGNAAILKPHEAAPLTSQLLADLFVEAGTPADRLHVIHGGPEQTGQLLADDRVAFTSFTGSTAVGTIVKQKSAHRPVALELGSIASTIVCAGVDVAAVADAIAFGGFRKSGQVCTSVQRVFVARELAEPVERALAERVRELKAGDPRDPGSDLGPVISDRAAARIIGMIEGSTAAGARVVVGGTRSGALVAPTLVSDVPDHAPLATEEVFGPVVALSTFDTLDEAIERVNASPYGLQAGIFTESVHDALAAARRIECGTVVINGTSNNRADGMPFGGQKASGFGKEGPAYAIRDMTVERLVLFR